MVECPLCGYPLSVTEDEKETVFYCHKCGYKKVVKKPQKPYVR